MDLKSVINSPGMWVASGIMVVVVLVQSVLFLREAIQEAGRIGFPRERWLAGARSAMITAIGPSLSPVVILLALIAVLGAPTTWMRMNDIGAARSELAISALATQVYGVDMRSSAFDLTAFSYALWGMALNNVGWMTVSLLLTHRMAKAIKTLNTRSNPVWVKLFMAGAMLGLFGYLLAGQLTAGWDKLFAGIVSAITMLFISRVLKNYPRMQELALGIAMLAGMFSAAAFF